MAMDYFSFVSWCRRLACRPLALPCRRAACTTGWGNEWPWTTSPSFRGAGGSPAGHSPYLAGEPPAPRAGVMNGHGLLLLRFVVQAARLQATRPTLQASRLHHG